MRYIVTGCAGFIGSHVVYRLLSGGHDVYGIDNFSGSYPAHLSKMRLDRLYELERLEDSGSFECHNIGITSKCLLSNITSYLLCISKDVTDLSFDAILHFAATPGVRRSIEEPQLYVENNIGGTVAILELARELEIPKVLLASSSSVYGDLETAKVRGRVIPPYDGCKEGYTPNPISPYAASKVAMEAMGLAYHNLYGMDILIPRYFSVYGSYGRPDMAYFIFMKLLSEGKPIEVFGDGEQLRDMTYIYDVVEATSWFLGKMKGYYILNIGSGRSVPLMQVVSLICKNMRVSPQIQYRDAKPGDPFATYADINKAKERMDWQPQFSIEEGIRRTVEWFTKVYWPECNKEEDNANQSK